MRTRIKFCGLTRPGDIRLAGELGVDAVGLVFAERSPRRLSLGQAQTLRLAAPPLLDLVALFMNNPADQVAAVVHLLRPHLLQFHGEEPEGFCARWGVPYLKAVPMKDAAGLEGALERMARYPSASGFVLDAHAPGEPGGSGRRFDWSRLPPLSRPWLLAGGLDPDNVAAAIAAVRPWGVDVSSGIESAPGLKDGARMRVFVEEVRRADSSARD